MKEKPVTLAETIRILERAFELRNTATERTDGRKNFRDAMTAAYLPLLSCARRCEAIDSVPGSDGPQRLNAYEVWHTEQAGPWVNVTEIRPLLDAAAESLSLRSERDALAKQAAKTREELLLELESFSAAYQREHDEALAKLQLMEPVDSTLARVRRALSDAGVPVLDSKKRAYETESRVLHLAQERDALAKRVRELESTDFVSRLRATNRRLRIQLELTRADFHDARAEAASAGVNASIKEMRRQERFADTCRRRAEQLAALDKPKETP